MTSNSDRKAYAGIGAAAASWGTWGFFLRQAAVDGPLSAELATFVVLTTMFVLLLPFALHSRSRVAAPRPLGAWVLLAVFGVSDALNTGLYFRALQTTTLAVAVLTHYAAPLIVAVLAPLVLREERRRGMFPIIALGIGGLCVLLAPWRVGEDPGASSWFVGAALGLASAFFYAFGVLFNKHLTRIFSPVEVLVFHLPSAMLVLGLSVPGHAFALTHGAMVWLLLGALGPGALAGIVFIQSLSRVPAGHAAVLTFVEPVTALFIAAWVWGEPLGVNGYVGALAVLGAGYLAVRATPNAARASAAADVGI
jgi:drug/metabolite transporter (DMT)-like permease